MNILKPVSPPLVYPGLAVFDLDRTLIVKNASFGFGTFLYRQGMLRMRQAAYLIACYLRYRKHPRLGKLHRKVFDAMFRGVHLIEVKAQVEAFLTRSLGRMLYMPVLRRFEEAKRRRECTLLLSNSPDFLVEAVAERLGFDGWGGTEYCSDAEGRLVSVGQVMEGDEKGKLTEKFSLLLGLQRDQVTCYSDSIADRSLLEAAGRAVAVRPDRWLRLLSRQRRWEVI